MASDLIDAREHGLQGKDELVDAPPSLLRKGGRQSGMRLVVKLREMKQPCKPVVG